MATPHGASQRALHRPTIHLTPQWADPRSYARWLCYALFPPCAHQVACTSLKRDGNARVDGEVCMVERMKTRGRDDDDTPETRPRLNMSFTVRDTMTTPKMLRT
ncbi:unnamed protein product [Lasius platythorax]|uniref:Uncharacterized protein n=1 Tax=Lasius platythorax TaxID=488582 RepID=A0AAV2NWW1_9HYME